MSQPQPSTASYDQVLAQAKELSATYDKRKSETSLPPTFFHMVGIVALTFVVMYLVAQKKLWFRMKDETVGTEVLDRKTYVLYSLGASAVTCGAFYLANQKWRWVGN